MHLRTHFEEYQYGSNWNVSILYFFKGNFGGGGRVMSALRLFLHALLNFTPVNFVFHLWSPVRAWRYGCWLT